MQCRTIYHGDQDVRAIEIVKTSLEFPALVVSSRKTWQQTILPQ